MTEFSVLQYNTLAGALATPESFPLVDPEVLNWEKRRQTLINEIVTHDPAVICLEEVDHFHDWFEPELTLRGYDGIFLQKTYDEKSPAADGCAIFYRRALFKLDTRDEIKFIEHIQEGPSGPPKQVALIAYLSVVDTNERVRIVCTHLKAGSSSEELRAAEAKVLVDHLQKDIDIPTVIAGDLNSKPSGKVKTLKVFTSAGFSSVFTDVQFTTWKLRPPHELRMVIDYLLYQHLTVTRKEPLPDAVPSPYLPSSIHPSDHLPLQATFKFSG
jgi:nocturnin